MQHAAVTYFYTAHSAYAYLGHQELLRIVRQSGREVVHKPFRLMQCLDAIGYHRLEERTNEMLDYQFGRQRHRWAEYRSVLMPAEIPSTHDNGAEIADLVLIAAEQEGIDVDYLSSVLMHNHWINNIDLNDEAAVRIILQAQGLDAAGLLQAAQTTKSIDTYAANTEEAIALSAFGSPTYVVDGDMFYGQDNLQLVERALQQPFN